MNTDIPALSIRRIQPTDNPAVAKIIRHVMSEFECSGEGYSIHDAEVDQMYEAYDHDRAAFYVVERDQIVCGCGGVGPLENGDDETVCELKKMYFLDTARGQGMGRRLLEQSLSAAYSIGYRTCYIESVARMEAAIRLYQKMGFRALDGPLGNTGHSSCEIWLARDVTANDVINEGEL